MKTYREWRYSFASQLLYPQVKSPLYPLGRRLGGFAEQI
jgi:hypothetical protein